jgi:hypothetical protein
VADIPSGHSLTPPRETKLIRKFVTLYEGEPDLWDSPSENYKNKHAREAALERSVAAMDLQGFTTKDCKMK